MNAARSRPERPGGSGSSAGLEEAEPAGRLRRPSWSDPRLLVGLLIVLGSVAGVVALVSAQDRTAPVYAADRTLSVGEAADQDSLRVVDVRIDELSEHYLSAEDELDSSLQFVSVVEEGELVPMRALAEADPLGRQAVTLDVDHTLAQGVAPGRYIDVWAAAPPSAPDGEEGGVEKLVGFAEVSSLEEATSTFGAQNAVSVELLVDPDELADLLAARSSGDALSVVPAGEQDAQESDQHDEQGSEGEG